MRPLVRVAAFLARRARRVLWPPIHLAGRASGGTDRWSNSVALIVVLMLGLNLKETGLAGPIPGLRLLFASDQASSVVRSVLPDACRAPAPALTAAPAAAAEAFPAARAAQMYRSITSQPGRWVDLTTLGWESATSGWQRLADFHSPRLGRAFPYTPLMMNGQQFPTGIGTYPLSEISYALAGEYAALRTRIGLDDAAPERGSAQFSIYADDVLMYRSPVMLRSEPPVSLEVPLLGADHLRLVVEDGDDGSTGDYADWIAPEVFRPARGAAALVAARAELARARTPTAGRGLLLVAETSPIPSITEELIPLGSVAATGLWFDEQQCLLVLGNPQLRVGFGYGGAHHGRISFAPYAGDHPALRGGLSELALVGGGRFSLADTRVVPDAPWDLVPVEDPALGSGAQLTIHLQAPLDSDDGVHVEITVFDGANYLTYRIRPTGTLAARGYRYLNGDAEVLVGERPRFLSDRGRVWRGSVPDDGLERTVPLQPSKPLLLWSEASGDGLLMATIDVSEAPMKVTLSRPPGAGPVDLGLGLRFLPVELRAGQPQASPRLWLQFVDAKHVLKAFGDYQAVMQRLYPAAPLPSWVKYQWNSWWTYGPSPTETGIKRQVDYIVENLGDLGPWHVVIDAAWYVAYGRPTADLRNVDYDKFPSGIRPVVDYAHERNVKALLFLPAGFVHSGQKEGGEWLALQAIIDEHPDWLIPLLEDSGIAAYMLNYAHPQVRAYMETVVTDAIQVHGADGILLDGLADPEGQFTGVGPRDTVAATSPHLPVTDIYRLIADRLRALRPDAYFEAGWVNPVFAHPYAHAFWWADDWPAFDNPYPFGGLLQHVDYALFQWIALGQRSKMGTVWGDPNSRDVQRWMEAALALGAQATMSFDLAGMEPDRLSALRSRLAHYNAFEGQTVASSRARPNAFATTTEHITYLGVMNRTSRAKAFGEEIGELGVLAPGLMAFDVERGSWLPALDVPGLSLPPKTFRLFLIPHQPRIVWSNASWSYEPSGDGGMVATLRGPASLQGFAQIWAPGAAAVLLDGNPLELAAAPAPGRYAFDARSGVVRIELTYDQPHQLEIRWDVQGRARSSLRQPYAAVH